MSSEEINTEVICVPLPGGGLDQKLKEILNAEILPLVNEFDQKLNNGNGNTFNL